MSDDSQANVKVDPVAREAAAAKKAAESKEVRSPRAIRSAARILHKEASRILKKSADRIAPEPAAQMRQSLVDIDKLRDAEDWPALQTEAERLDELLEQHASFARKGALRETVENIGVAVLIALGLRSCLYEPFKIPSGSMMPTLRNGDHIFVNKFTYGIQVPFTTTVVGQSIGTIERGDVIVFRFPLDETQDFIKRVVGLPGDEIKVAGRTVSIKRAGESEFEELPRRKLEQPCYGDDGKRPVANCTLYEEQLGEHEYVVRYRLTTEERGDLSPEPQIWRVPDGHLMVMGDNRNDSLDSRRWRETVEAVKADGLLSTKDLRDLTDERLFSMTRPGYIDQQADPTHDHVVFRASHRALDHDLALEVWREPTLGARAVYDARVATLDNAEATDWTALVGTGEGASLDAMRRHSESIVSLHVATDEHSRHAVLMLKEPEAVLALSCGVAVCSDDQKLATRLGEIIDRLEQNRGREARELLVRPTDAASTYSSQFKSRHSPRDHFYERHFSSPEEGGPRGQVHLRAFRRPDEGTELVRDAALRSVGIDPTAADAPAPAMSDGGVASWMVDGGNAWVSIAADTAREMVVVIECGKVVCNRQAAADALAAEVHPRIPRAAGDRRRMAELLVKQDLDGLAEVPTRRPELAEYDRVGLESTIKDDAHSVELQAWLNPEGGTAAKIAELRENDAALQADDAALPGAFGRADDDAVVFVFPVDESDAVLELTCHRGLCPSRQAAVALAQRAANRAADPSNFIDPEAQRPKPFVPRGNVKGRAERIWLPFSRFWLAIP